MVGNGRRTDESLPRLRRDLQLQLAFSRQVNCHQTIWSRLGGFDLGGIAGVSDHCVQQLANKHRPGSQRGQVVAGKDAPVLEDQLAAVADDYLPT